MKKRDFIKTGLLVVAGSITPLSRANVVSSSTKKVSGFKNAMPDYSADRVSGLFSNNAFMSHINGYSNNARILQSELSKLTFAPNNIKSILSNANNYNPSLVNRAVEHYNHKMFFKQFGNTETSKRTSVLSAINNKYGGLKQFKLALEEAIKELNNEGWIWLAYKSGGLQIIALKGNKNPLLSTLNSRQKGFPVLGIDMHEHCFGTDYKNNKAGYINNVVDSLNWNYIEQRYKRALTV